METRQTIIMLNLNEYSINYSININFNRMQVFFSFFVYNFLYK